MSEHDLLALFLREAPKALPRVRVFRRNIIRRQVQIEGRDVHLVNGIPGQGDAYALVRASAPNSARHVEIETKAAQGRMRAAQERWAAFCAEWGVPHLVLRARAGEEPRATVTRWIDELRTLTEAIP